MKEGIYMAIPVFKYDEDLKQLYSEEGEVTVAVQGDDFGRCVQFEIPTVINDAESKATGNITSTSKVYLVWQNAHGDTGRKIAGASSDMLDSMAIQDGVCIVTFYLPDAFTAYAGKACLALEITDSDGEHGTRFAPVEVKVAQFVLDPFSKDLREDRIPDSLRAKAGAVTELYYDPVEKKLAASEELKKAFVKGDIMGRAINIILPRDLGGYGVVSETDELTIIYKNANGQTGEYLVPSRNMAFYDRRSWAMNHHDDGIDVCLIQFGIPAPLATYSGEAEIEIEIKKPGGQITHLSPVKLQVGEFFDQSDIEPDDPKYSIVEQLKSEVAYLSAKIDQIVTGDNEISLDSYLTKTEAASTYETQTNADLLLSKAGAASTYLTKADAASDYLKKADFVASNPFSGVSLTTGSGYLIHPDDSEIMVMVDEAITSPITFILYQDVPSAALEHNFKFGTTGQGGFRITHLFRTTASNERKECFVIETLGNAYIGDASETMPIEKLIIKEFDGEPSNGIDWYLSCPSIPEETLIVAKR